MIKRNYGFKIPKQFFGPLYHAFTLQYLYTIKRTHMVIKEEWEPILWYLITHIASQLSPYLRLDKCTKSLWFAIAHCMKFSQTNPNFSNGWHYGECPQYACIPCRKKKRKINDVNLIMLALSCSRIPLVQGGAYYLPCSGWALAYLGTYD